MAKRLQQVDEATGNVFTGEGGLMQELQAIAADPAYDSWWKQLGASGVAATEAVGQGLLKSLGILGADAEYLGRGVTDAMVGGGEKLDERTAEQIEAARQQITAQTQQAISALEEERNAISNNPDMFNTEEGKARLAEIGEEIANRTAGLQSRLDELANVPVPTEALTETITSLPQQGFNLLDSMFEQYEKNVAAGEAAREAERKEALRRDIDAASNEAIESQRGTLSDDDYKLGQIAQAMFQGQPGNQQSPPPPEGGGSSTATKRSGLDKVLDIASLLGGAAGSSKGYEAQSILNQQRQDRILEDQQAFELAKQQALLDQRTEERQLIEDQRLAIARAGAMADIDLGQIMLDPAVRQKREELIEKHDVFFGGYDEEAVERELNAFILQLLNQRRQEVGALYDTMQSGGGSATPPVSTEGFGELRVN